MDCLLSPIRENRSNHSLLRVAAQSPEIIRVILQVLLYILIQMAGRGVNAVDREELAPA